LSHQKRPKKLNQDVFCGATFPEVIYVSEPWGKKEISQLHKQIFALVAYVSV
jgi:hypothetical protein